MESKSVSALRSQTNKTIEIPMAKALSNTGVHGELLANNPKTHAAIPDFDQVEKAGNFNVTRAVQDNVTNKPLREMIEDQYDPTRQKTDAHHGGHLSVSFRGGFASAHGVGAARADIAELFVFPDVGQNLPARRTYDHRPSLGRRPNRAGPAA